MEKVFEFEARSEQLPGFRADLRGLLEKAGFDEKTSGEIVLAVDECLTNIIRHAYGPQSGKIQVSFRDNEEQTRISLCDFGKKFDPTLMPKPELPPQKPGGLGIFLTKELMDDVAYDPDFKEGNLLHLIKYKSGKQR